MSLRKQYYGIKYPFTDKDDEGFFIDLNGTLEDKVASEILHTVLTRRGTRLRMPEFGTRLIDYIFSPNDEFTWQEIEDEVRNAVKRYVQNVSIGKIEVLRDEGSDNGVYIDIRYSVARGYDNENNRILVKI